MKKVLFILLSCLLVVFGILFMYSCEWVWQEAWGSYDLGNEIYMLESENGKGGRVILKGTYIERNICFGGSYLIPAYESRYDSTGNFAEYVIDAKFDNNWIIAKTGNYIDGKKKYYIVDKSFDLEKTPEEDIVKNYIFDYSDSLTFAEACHVKGIKIKW